MLTVKECGNQVVRRRLDSKSGPKECKERDDSRLLEDGKRAMPKANELIKCRKSDCGRVELISVSTSIRRLKIVANTKERTSAGIHSRQESGN